MLLELDEYLGSKSLIRVCLIVYRTSVFSTVNNTACFVRRTLELSLKFPREISENIHIGIRSCAIVISRDIFTRRNRYVFVYVRLYCADRAHRGECIRVALQ